MDWVSSSLLYLNFIFMNALQSSDTITNNFFSIFMSLNQLFIFFEMFYVFINSPGAMYLDLF